MRKTEFANGEYYHIYNRGVDKREVFLDEKDYERFLICMKEFNTTESIEGLFHLNLKRKAEATPGVASLRHRVSKDSVEKLVSFVCYCLNPNHYHFILCQETENGISKFMHKIGMGYTKYFNKKYNRSGSLFQGQYKAIHINSNEYLLLLSAYVNANHEIHGSLEKDWPYSSFLDYTGKRDGKLCNKEIILGQFDNNFFEYEKYIKNNADYFREKKELEEYILE